MKKIALFLAIIVISSFLVGCINFGNDDSLINKIDTDGDGMYDYEDDFPNDPSASVDSDDDGFPDKWNIGKNQEDSNSNLTIDSFLDDPAASRDTDNDGYPDEWNKGKDQSDSTSIPPLELDEFPDDPNSHKDTDKDGIADYYDINDFVDLSINIRVDQFKVTGRVDIFRWAQVYIDVYINNVKEKRIDNNGKPWSVWLNQEKKITHGTIHYDIRDDTKNKYTEIEIIMYDNDLIGRDDIIDISYESGEKTLLLKFDNAANTILCDGITIGEQGALWYDITNKESDIPYIETYKKNYRWNYNNKFWELLMEIPVNLYKTYKESTIKRDPRTDKGMASFVTSNDEVISDLSAKLLSLAEGENYNSVTTVNFILRFVQKIVNYKFDEKSCGVDEYWRFAVETLVDQEGDCEDTSILFASIMKNLDYDIVFLLYNIEQDGEKLGHLSVGVHLDGNHGHYVEDNSGKKYLYCETTNGLFSIGQLPSNIKGDPIRIIHL